MAGERHANHGNSQGSQWFDPIIKGPTSTHGIHGITGLQIGECRQFNGGGAREILPDLQQRRILDHADFPFCM